MLLKEQQLISTAFCRKEVFEKNIGAIFESTSIIKVSKILKLVFLSFNLLKATIRTLLHKFKLKAMASVSKWNDVLL